MNWKRFAKELTETVLCFLLGMLFAIAVLGCGYRRDKIVAYGGILESRYGEAGARRSSASTDSVSVLQDTMKGRGEMRVEGPATSALVCESYGLTSEGVAECSLAHSHKVVAERLSDFCTASPENANTEMCVEFVRPRPSVAHEYRRASGYAGSSGCYRGPVEPGSVRGSRARLQCGRAHARW